MTVIAEYQRVPSTHFRAPKLISLLPGPPAWLYLAFNPLRCGPVMAIDGRETWLIHNFLYNDEPDYDSIDRDWAIRQILGVDPEFEYDVISNEDWIGRRLVADRFHNGHVFTPATPRIFDPACRLRHECRHRRCREPVMDAGRRAEWMGGAEHP